MSAPTRGFSSSTSASSAMVRRSYDLTAALVFSVDTCVLLFSMMNNHVFFVDSRRGR